MADILDKQLEVLGADIVNNMRRTLTTKRISASGNLRDSIQANVEPFKNNASTLQISMAGYGTIVDEGRGRTRQKGISSRTTGFFADLKSWVRAKLGITNKQKLEQVTYLVYRKINQRGFAPKPFIESSINEALRKNQDKIDDAAFRLLINQTDAVLKQYYKK